MPPDPHADDPLLQPDPQAPLRWLFLDLNSYFASVEQQEDPALRGRPVGVVPSEGENTSLIAVSLEGKRLGLRTGTPVHEARRLCPGIALRPARHALYVAYHQRVLAAIEHHAPVSRAWSVDEFSVRLSGAQRLPAGAVALARAIRAGIAEDVGECLRCSIGLAPSWRLAKLATELEKPDGLVALLPEDLPARLLPIGLRDFPGIGERLAARLARSGVTDVRGLWEMGPKRARAVWNSVEGERFWYGLRGADIPEPPLPVQPGSLGHARVLPPELRDPDGARHVARLLAQKATARLRAAGCLAGLVILEARPGRSESVTETLHAALKLRPTDDERAVLEAVEAMWRAWLARPGAPRRLRHVSVTLAEIVSARDHAAAPDLFAADLPSEGIEAPNSAPGSALGAALDRVHQRFGRGSLTIGAAPRDWEAYAGEKIAFSRVPMRKG